MNYVEVWVSSSKYHNDKPLTYCSQDKLNVGALAVVPLKTDKVPAVVVKNVKKPDFPTKEILSVVSESLLPVQLLKQIDWLRVYYPAPFGQIMTLIVPSNVKSRRADSSQEIPLAQKIKTNNLQHLTKEQSDAVNLARKTSPNPLLLHGETGTGKTRVYIELILNAFKNGKSSIVLTPEIGLTPQISSEIEAIFPGSVVTLHSNLSPPKRREAWFKILESKRPLIIVGARSALFAPLRDVGVVVVDEFHETSFKQEQAPHYQTSRVAAHLAQLHNAQLILGSATPPVSDYFAFKEKSLKIARMTELAASNNVQTSTPKIVNIRERDSFIKSKWMSDDLVAAIESALSRNEQSMLFLNRRGTARVLLCQNCGWRAECANCDLTLTYHGDVHEIRCHTCGYASQPPSVCPECQNTGIIFKTIGTKLLESELIKLFPGAKIKRFDSDVKKPERLEQIYEQIKHGSVDIIVGTQMIAKGLDLPNLSVLGVVLADTSLTFPDYTAEERTYQLLSQVLGRVNRGHRESKIFVQTYQPESALIKSAIQKDYGSFYSTQINERRSFRFPPFCYLLKLSCSYSSQEKARKTSQALSSSLKKSGQRIEVVGPSPCFIEKAQNKYRWQVVVKSKNRSVLLKIIADLPASWSYDIDPVHLL